MQDNISHQFDGILRQLIQEEIENYFNRVGLPRIERNHTMQTVCIFGWRKSTEKLRKLFLELKSRGYISCSYESFEAIFLHQPLPINWLSSIKNLVYVFSGLVINDSIYRNEKFHLLLAQNFLDKRNQQLKTDTLKTTLCRFDKGEKKKDLELILSVCN